MQTFQKRMAIPGSTNMNRQSANSFRRALLLAAIVTCVGCTRSSKVDVGGTVTLNGKPLAGGTVVFEPADRQGASFGGTIEEGKYSLTGDSGVSPGEKIVRVTGVWNTGRQVPVGPPAPPGTMTEEVKEIPIPAAYNQNSTLKVTVTEGAPNQHDFTLTSK
jgi:hypothetical protein